MRKIRRRSRRRLYRLVVDAGGTARVAECQADGAYGAFLAAQRLGAGQEVEIFEDGRPLARVRTMGRDGYWVISPPLASASATPATKSEQPPVCVI